MELSPQALRLLCAAGDGDAALLYLWQTAGDATLPCPLTPERKKHAEEILTRLGLVPQPEKPLHREVRPEYSESAVKESLRQQDFQNLLGQAQRQLGRVLSTEETKGLLSIYDYLRMPTDVVSILISHCIQRTRDRSGNMPGMRTIEKEASRWVDMGIDNLDAAMQYMQAVQLRRNRRFGICRVLQITDRRLTQAEEQYVNQWVDWGFPDDVIGMAYEKTCLNTGGLNWAYMHKILTRWQQAGLLTADRIRGGDTKPGSKPQPGQRQLDADEQAAIARMLQEV